jgi:hypothetical protein
VWASDVMTTGSPSGRALGARRGAILRSFAPNRPPRSLCRGRTMEIIARIIAAGIIVLAGGCSPVEGAYGAESASSGDALFVRAFPVREDHPTVGGKEVHPAVTGLVAGRDGDLWLAGTFACTLDLGAGAIHADGHEVFFVARLDPRGEARWSTRIGNMGSTRSQGVALSPAGDAFVIDQSAAPEGGSFLTKLDPGGVVLWRRAPFQVEQGPAELRLIVTDGAGGVVIVGWLDGVIHAGSTRISAGGSTFAVGLDAEGQPRWARLFGRSSDDSPIGAATDSAGNVIVLEESSIEKQAPLTKLDRSGGVIWRKPFERRPPPVPNGDWVVAGAVAVDPDDNILVAGDGPADLGGDPVMNPFGGPWLVKLNPMGELIWRKDREASLLGADGSGDVRLVRRTERGFSAMRLNAYGDPVWTRDFPSGGQPRAMVVDPAGRMIVAGSFHGALDLGGATLSSGDRDAIFLAALAP